MKKCLIITNGNPPSKFLVNYFINKGYNKIFCADGALKALIKFNIVPDFIIGDLDSIYENEIVKLSPSTRLIKISRQSDSDVEKCIKHAIKLKYTEAVLLGADGGRLDHSIANLSQVIKYFPRIILKIVNNDSFLFPITKKIQMNSIKGEIISIFAFSSKVRVSTEGLKYKLTNALLVFGRSESLSNSAMKRLISIEVKNGIAFVVRDFNFLRKYDLI
jgi:thiamine pyrophosphokinase